MSTATPIDWRSWAERWDRQQEGYLPDREERFAIMLDYVARRGTRVSGSGTGALRVVDLCCGPGSISARLLQRFPQATSLAVDIDPWLVEMGRQTVARDYPGRIEWLEVDLRRDDWTANLAPGSFDAVLSATALHWIQPEDLIGVYRHLAGLLAAGGLFLNADLFVLVYFFAVRLRWLPVFGTPTPKGIILPAVVLALANTALLTRITRATILEILGQDYVRVARAKGLRSLLVLRRHVLSNAMPPMLTVLGLEAAQLMTGAAVVEYVFAWPGIGKLAVDSALVRDTPVVVGFAVSAGLIYVATNLCVDLAVAAFDPRIRSV